MPSTTYMQRFLSTVSNHLYAECILATCALSSLPASRFSLVSAKCDNPLILRK